MTTLPRWSTVARQDSSADANVSRMLVKRLGSRGGPEFKDVINRQLFVTMSRHRYFPVARTTEDLRWQTSRISTHRSKVLPRRCG